MVKRYEIWPGLLPAALIFFACSGGGSSRTPSGGAARNQAPELSGSSSPPVIAVSILPQSWFVSRIAGNRARVLVLAGPGQNPHNYEPTPRQMQELAEARAWIFSGLEFEIGLKPKIQALFPQLLMVDGTAGVRFRSLEEHGDGDHGEGLDRHTWLGAEPAKILAAHVRDTLSTLDKEGADFYRANCEALVEDINGEFEILKKDLAPLRGRRVFVYHPSFGYFLDEFGIIQAAVETGGKEPGPRDLKVLIDRVKDEKAAAIFVQAQFPANAARTLAAAAGAELVVLDPLAPDWLANIRVMGGALKKAAGGDLP
jgi:zinc transport system substrate-binding protein